MESVSKMGGPYVTPEWKGMGNASIGCTESGTLFKCRPATSRSVHLPVRARSYSVAKSRNTADGSVYRLPMYAHTMHAYDSQSDNFQLVPDKRRL